METLFCPPCQDKIHLPVEYSKTIPNGLTLGCDECRINNNKTIQLMKKKFNRDSFKLANRSNPNYQGPEIPVLAGTEEEAYIAFNGSFFFSTKGTNYRQTFHIVENGRREIDFTYVTNAYYAKQALRYLQCNHAIWMESVLPKLQSQCLPLVLVTRAGWITATVARYILLMIGNELMNPYQVYDQLVYPNNFSCDNYCKI